MASELNFDEIIKESIKFFNKNKVYLKSKGMVYYKDPSSSPITLNEMLNSEKRKQRYDPNPNLTTWAQCGYINSEGKKCTNQGIFYQNEIDANPEYDYEKHTDIHFCEMHKMYEKKELAKRHRELETLKQERPPTYIPPQFK
jgi:hypothetical protein